MPPHRQALNVACNSMDTLQTHKGHITRYDNERHFGFIETAENEIYFFFHDKAEVIKQKKEGKIKTVHKHCSGDEVEFKLKRSLKDNEKFEAYDIVFIRNERRDNLIKEALINPKLLGYLKLIDNEKLFVKHINTYVFIPVQISEWESDLQTFYFDRIDKLVEFNLTQTEKVDKLAAVLTNRKFVPEYKTIIDLYTKGQSTTAIITGKNQSGYFAVLSINQVDAFIPISKGLNKTETDHFYRFKKGDTVNVKLKFVNTNKKVSLELIE